MKLRVGAVFIPVLNLQDSISWYSECLGLHLVDNWGQGASFTFKHGESLITLIQVEEIQPVKFNVTRNQTNVYFHFETDDITQTCLLLESKGVEITESIDHGIMNEIFIKDPSGNELSIYCENILEEDY